MHSVLIISDSHGWMDELSVIRDRHEDTGVAIHCGDSELNENDSNLLGYRTVKGNCDWNGDFPDEKVFEYGGLTFLVVHGHLFDVKHSFMKLEFRAQEVEADIVCFGHSHVAFAEKVNNRILLNPGSIRLPRHFRTESYAILSWEDPKEIRLEFFNNHGDQITEFPYPANFYLK